MPTQKKQSGFGIASLVLGIIGLLTVCIFIGIFPCILGVIFAMIALCDKSKRKGLAIAGLSCSVVGLLVYIPWFIFINITPTENAKINSEDVYVLEDTEYTRDFAESYELEEESIIEFEVSEESSKEMVDVNSTKKTDNEGYGIEHVIAILLLLGFFGLIAWALIAGNSDKSPQYDGKPRKCPRCGGERFHAFVQEEVVVPAKVKSKTTLNMNPLKTFTVFNHKEKVVREQITRNVSRFVCDDCGKIFQ